MLLKEWAWIGIDCWCLMVFSYSPFHSVPLHLFIHCGSCHATSGPFWMWSASLSNIQLLTVFVKACLRHCPESLVGKDRYHYINNINNKRYTFINSETQGAGGLLPKYNSSFTLPQTPPIWVYFVTLHIASSFEFVRCQRHIVQSPSQL